jgi:alkylated DNA repair dioxygenase AlkB
VRGLLLHVRDGDGDRPTALLPLVSDVSMRFQVDLFDRGVTTPSVNDEALGDIRRQRLDDDSWVDYLPGWVRGHDHLMDELHATTRWQSHRREMYDRTVDVPRLVASLPDDGPGHSLLTDVGNALSRFYATRFEHISLAYYRSGADSVAWHGDYVARALPDALVATVSLGSPRRFLLRPKGGGNSVRYTLGWGDLLVMGGACQRTWQHAIPKVAHAAPRLAIMFRPTWYRSASKLSSKPSSKLSSK